MRTIQIPLQKNPYNIYIGTGLLDRPLQMEGLAAALNGRRTLIVSDETVYALHGEKVGKVLREVGCEVLGVSLFEAGEPSKRISVLEGIWDDMVRAPLDRKSMVFALGGGVVGDMAGFAAATFMRGIDFIQIPTTLLAMVDSSVGGKTGVDHPLGKNLIGAFHQPRAVVIDLKFFETLPEREVLSGFAEVVKAAILGDEELFYILEREGPGLIKDPELLEVVVSRAVSVKAKVVAEDEFEGGKRALLNLGHTLGHAVETVAGYGAYTHGEAVAMGLYFAVALSRAKGLIDELSASRIENLLLKWGYKNAPEELSGAEIIAAMKHDKKSSGGSVKWVLPLGIGDARWGLEVEEALIDAQLEGKDK